jgi:pyruvate dehydrogenase E2 component (dihydrolipoamide acetyltransferase)
MIKIIMPQAGQTMEEGSILVWRKKEGEQVHKGEVLLEIETDKANVEVEATESGVLRKILCPEGITVPVLAPIAILAAPSDDITALLQTARGELKSLLGSNGALVEALGLADAGPAAPAASVEVSQSLQPEVSLGTEPSAPYSTRMKASPAARKIARTQGVDLSTLMPGSGPGGRILSTDVARAPSTAPPSGVRRPLTGMRRAIARNLLLSKQTIPHFYMRITIDAAAMLAFYRSEKARYACTLNDVIVLACARILQEFPAFRSRIDGDQVWEADGAGIGIAVGMEDGLRVPVLEGAHRMSLKQVADESRRIIEAAQRGKLEGVGRGIFTISNLGMFGIEEFAAIINPPEAAILAVGAVREDVVVKDGALRAAKVMTMTLSADHRVVDGLLAAKFLARLKAVLEAPEPLAHP